MSTPVDLHLSITAPIIVGAKWTRAGRDIERQFILPLHVRGTPADCLPKVIAGIEAIMADLINQVETAERSAARGFTYKFPRMTLLQEPSDMTPGALLPPIPEPTDEQRAAVAAMLAPIPANHAN